MTYYQEHRTEIRAKQAEYAQRPEAIEKRRERQNSYYRRPAYAQWRREQSAANRAKKKAAQGGK